ncbi:hypothetical protein [Bradyrhizobium sp.]|uniref:hypothetical protein n=1 Tax=Bradyrhizobium sp. TaxID=376 RepID=UPI002736600A|nr:hypothetical protein [Bradyrhizobium sp.]MDP3691933.1 hypothetical protein [Bradyrhizobium sp.]
MSNTAPLPDFDRYEQACDQAIAMCDGNLRSTIKALIMANEYLETELQELQAAISSGREPSVALASEAASGSREETASRAAHANSDAA